MRISKIFILLFSLTCFAQHSDFKDVDFKKADSIAKNYEGASLENLPVLTYNLTRTLETDVEKFRAIYTWISTNIENDYSSYLKISNKRKRLVNKRQAYLQWNTGITPKVFKTLLKDRKTACTGYAYLVKEMANLAGFKCNIINGYGRTPTLLLDESSAANHSWNSIEIDNKWYLCDATWSAGQTIIDNGIPRFEPNYFDGYFLAEPKLFAKNHFPSNSNETPAIHKDSLKTFMAGPVIYKDAFSASILPVLPINMHTTINKGESVSFSLKLPIYFTGEIQLVINKRGVQYSANPIINRADNELCLTQVFEKKGLYDVHITIDSKLITTYVIKVK